MSRTTKNALALLVLFLGSMLVAAGVYFENIHDPKGTACWILGSIWLLVPYAYFMHTYLDGKQNEPEKNEPKFRYEREIESEIDRLTKR